MSVHTGIAALTRTPELALSEGEGKALAHGITNVARHYEWLNGASQKMVDWSNLITVCGMVYGSRLYAIKRRTTVPPPPPGPPPVPARDHSGGNVYVPLEVSDGAVMQ